MQELFYYNYDPVGYDLYNSQEKNDFYSLSSFIDRVFPGETRCRHFKRLETLRKYNIYDKTKLFKLDKINRVCDQLEDNHLIVRQTNYVSFISDDYIVDKNWYDANFYKKVRSELEDLLDEEHKKHIDNMKKKSQ